MHISKGSNLVKGSKSCTICTNFTSRINLTSHTDLTSRINLTTLRKKDKIKAKKANRAKSRDQLPRASIKSPYKLRFKLKSTVKRTKFSNTIVKIAKAILVAKVKLE